MDWCGRLCARSSLQEQGGTWMLMVNANAARKRYSSRHLHPHNTKLQLRELHCVTGATDSDACLFRCLLLPYAAPSFPLNSRIIFP